MLKTSLLMIALVALTACPGVSGSAANPNNPQQSAGMMVGTVLDSAGKPIQGAKVYADHTQYYNTNGIGVTDANGNYQINVSQPVGSWHATAQITKLFNGQTYTFDLDPNNDDPFSGTTGAVRNFTWKLSGKRPDGFDYGQRVVAYADFSQFEIDMNQVELTLQPVGALPDGSTGKTIRATLSHTADGDAISDVPLARYKITAKLASQALQVRVRNQGQYLDSVTTDFYSILPTVHRIEIEVNRP
jgi:hypothetical protein